MLIKIARSAWLLIGDLSGTLLFALLLTLRVDVIIATIAGIAMAVANVAWTMWRKKPVGSIQWLSLVLVIVSGLATLATSDPRYVMAKLSVISVIVGLFMLRPGWLLRYIPDSMAEHVGDVTWVFGFVWAGLMFVTAALNMLFVLRFTEHWPAFIAVFPALSKALLFAAQWVVSILVLNRRQAAANRLQPELARKA
jgi:intracellular septation protein